MAALDQRGSTTPRSLPPVPGAEHEYVRVGDLRMHVAFAGDPEGEPLLLLHGWPQHWFAWRRLLGPLAERYRVICPDLRGFGWTAAPPGTYLKSALAADVVGLLDALGLQRVRLAGHDWGGFVGFLLCIEHPERISHFVAAGIVHPWTRPQPGFAGLIKNLRRISYMALISSPILGKQVVRRVPAFVRTVMRVSAMDAERTWTDAELEAFVSQWREPDRAAACVALYRSFLTREMRGIASGQYRSDRIEIPVVLLAGVADPVIRPENLGGFEANAPRMRVEAVADAGHWVPEEAPEAMLAAMLDLYETPSPLPGSESG